MTDWRPNIENGEKHKCKNKAKWKYKIIDLSLAASSDYLALMVRILSLSIGKLLRDRVDAGIVVCSMFAVLTHAFLDPIITRRRRRKI